MKGVLRPEERERERDLGIVTTCGGIVGRKVGGGPIIGAGIIPGCPIIGGATVIGWPG